MEKQKLDCILEFVQCYLKKCFETLELFESEGEAGIIANAKLYENFLDFLNTDYPKRKKTMLIYQTLEECLLNLKTNA